MKTQELLDKLIDAEKNIVPDSELKKKILTETTEQQHKHYVLWPKLAIAASIAIVFMLGVKLGGKFNVHEAAYSSIVIDDNKIENLDFYSDAVYE
ncbi:MAG: hypothetical protein PHH37_13800 [Paludibacter sp.]|nr:hypothetical protein [Paludibacter sp.]